ncbi:hypothetical protein GGR56DRAFT_118056 [Xylariaceae sp. FL0804]|nr:hypothetical protein GGR56DRAFT_118056 [Xylariaceae sp. FL0804]
MGETTTNRLQGGGSTQLLPRPATFSLSVPYPIFTRTRGYIVTCRRFLCRLPAREHDGALPKTCSPQPRNPAERGSAESGVVYRMGGRLRTELVPAGVLPYVDDDCFCCPRALQPRSRQVRSEVVLITSQPCRSPTVCWPPHDVVPCLPWSVSSTAGVGRWSAGRSSRLHIPQGRAGRAGMAIPPCSSSASSYGGPMARMNPTLRSRVAAAGPGHSDEISSSQLDDMRRTVGRAPTPESSPSPPCQKLLTYR